MKAITLFNLKPNVSPEAYKIWSLEQVQPRMIKMPSVVAFQDFQVGGVMGGGESRFEFVEEITITSVEEFELDNSQGDGLMLADEWASKVSDYSVLYCYEIVP